MARLLLPCVLLFVMLAVAPAASAMPVDPVAVSAQQSCSIVGTERNDRLAGTGADDRVCGLGGRDRLRGNGGHDVVLGGGGGDLLQGKAGSDRLDGGPGNDRAFGGAGADDVRGGSGNDVLGGGLGPDGMSGGSGRDIVVYGQRGVPVVVTIGAGANDGVAGERDNVKADVESVQGGRGNDVLTGNNRANRLFGGGGNDRVLGKGGSDVLIGAGGDDRLDAREGATAAGRAAQAGAVDRVVCGEGNDTALVDPVDIVDPSCENVVGGAGTTPPQNPPAQNPPAQNPPAPQNNAPTAVDDSATVVEDSAAGAIEVLDNDTDSDGGAKAIASASDPANGTVVLTGGSPGAYTGLTYQPDPDYCNDPPGTTPETFTYALNGGSTSTVTVTVTCVDDPQTAVDDAATVPEDSAATPLAVLANDSDPDGDPVTIASASDPVNGTVVLTGGLPGAHTGLTYQPDPNFCNDPPGTTPDTFTYALNGGATATVSVTVTCGDDAPTAVADTATVGEDSAAGAIDVLANDTDSDGGAMTIASASDPANGAVVLTGGSAGAHTGLTYQPDPNFCGPDSFTYTLNGGSIATVSVTVTCVDDAPTAVDDSASVVEDSPPGAIAVLANDTDVDGGPMSVASVMQPANGTVVITGGASGLTYQPNANYCNDPPGTAPDTFTYTLNGGDSATVSVTVTCVDDAPTAVNDSATVAEGAAASAVDVLANDTDVDGGAKSVASVTQSTNGTVVITGDGTGLTYKPNPGYCNDPPGTTPDVFTYTLNGGSTATVSVTVSCDDNPPTAVDDSATVAEDSPASAIAVLANDTDTDGGPKTVASVTQPTNGTVVITGGGSGLTYQPAPNYCNSQAGGAPDTFTYMLNGGDSATVSVTVTCVDDPPTAVNDAATVVEDSAAGAVAVLANDLNADGGPITISSASDPANGTVAVTGGGTGLTYQPDPNYCSATPDVFTYTLNGGSTATVSMTVTCAPDNPVVDTSAGSTSYTENAAATVIDAAVTVSDVDAGTTITGATVKITGGYAGAEDILALGGTHPGITPVVSGDTLTLSGNASVAAYQAALRAVTYSNGSDAPSTAPRTVTFTVTDDTARTGSDTKGLTVSAVDDPPTAVNDSATVLEDAAATAIAVLTNDTDVDAGPRSVASVTQPANGTVVITGGGTGLTYQPNANYCNTPPGTTLSTFTYTLNGGSSATVSVTVTCVNDAPVADDETFDGANGAIGNTSLVVNAPGDGAPALSSPKKSITGDILAGDSDIDGPGPLTVTPGTFATNDGGSVTIEADGDFIYINDPADNCADTSDFFDYTVSDQNPAGPGPAPGTDTGRVTIAVAGCVWYVSNNATGNSGSSIAPFDTLTQAETASAANHTVFVFDGDNTSTGYGGNGYTMNSGERLIGEHEGLTVDPDGAGGPLAAQTLHPANPGAHPTLTATGADVIDLDDANEVRGLTLDPSGAGGGIAGATGDVSGTIDDVNITDTGTAGTQPGLELDATTGSFAVSNLAVSTNGATGVRLNNAGTVTFAPTGNISITTAGAPGLNVTGAAATPVGLGTSTFDAITVTGSTTGAVNLTNTTGTTTFGDLALTTTSGATAAFALSNAGTVSVPAAGTTNVSATGGPAVDVTGTTVSPLAFDAVSSTNSTTDGINLAGLGTGTFSAASGTISGAAGIAFDLDGGSGDVSYPGALNNGAGATAEITGRSGGAVALSGAIADTNDAGGGINLASNTGGSTTFSNATKTLNTGANAAVTLSSNTGHTINFTGGGLDIDTTSGNGVSATGGGTVTVQGAGNTIDSTTGTALNVTSTTIGAGGLTFQRTAANGATSGIVLNATGSNALTVTGTDGGDADTAPDAGSGGTIQNTTGDGVALTSTSNTSLGGVTISNTGAEGINKNGGSNLTLTTVQLLGAGNSDNEDGLQLVNAGGTVSIQGSAFADAEEELIEIDNNNTNLTLNVGTITPSTFTHGATLGSFTGNGIVATARGSTNLNFNVEDSTFTNIKLFAIQVGGDNTWSGNNNNLNYDNNDFITTITNTLGNPNNRANTLNTQGRATSDVDASVTNNVIDGGGGGGIQFGADESSSIEANITGNNVSDQFADGVLCGVDENANMTLLVDSNTISNTSSDGMEIANAIFPGGTSTLNATITNNTVTGHNNNAGANSFFGGIAVFGGADAPDVTFVDINGNNVSGNPNPGTYFDYAVDGSSFGDAITVEGPGTSAVAEADFLAAPPPANISGSAAGGRTFIGNASYSNGATVPLPTLD